MATASKMIAKQIILADDEEEETIECGGATFTVCKKQIVLSDAETDTDGETATEEEDEEMPPCPRKREAVDENAPPKRIVQSINVDNEVFAGPVTMAERIVSHRIGGSRRATIQEAVPDSPKPLSTSVTMDQVIVESNAEEELAVHEATNVDAGHSLTPSDACGPCTVSNPETGTTEGLGEAEDNSVAPHDEDKDEIALETDVTNDSGEDDTTAEAATTEGCSGADDSSVAPLDEDKVEIALETDVTNDSGEDEPQMVDDTGPSDMTVELHNNATEESRDESTGGDANSSEMDTEEECTAPEALEEGEPTVSDSEAPLIECTPPAESVEEEDYGEGSREVTEESSVPTAEESLSDEPENIAQENVEEKTISEETMSETEEPSKSLSGDTAEPLVDTESVEVTPPEKAPSAFEKASHALSEGFAEVVAIHRQRQEFRQGLEEAKERVAIAVTALMKQKERQIEEEEEAKKRRESAERVAQEMARRFIEKFSEQEKRRFEKECEEKISAILKKKMAKVELSKARVATLETFVRSLVSKTRESLAEMKKEAREEAIRIHLEIHHERQKEIAEKYSMSVKVIQCAMRRYAAARELAQKKRQKEEKEEKEEERQRVLSVMAYAVDNIVKKQKEKEREALKEKQEEVMEKMVESFLARIAKQKAEEELEEQKKKDSEAARKRRESIDAAKARVKALQQQRKEERERKQKQLEDELQTFAEKGGSTLRAASASYVATAAPLQSPVLPSAPKQATTTGVSCSGAQTVSVPADKGTSGMTLREQTHQKLALLREQRRLRMEQATTTTTTTTEKLKEITEHWSKKVDSITAKKPAVADSASSEKEKNLAETKKRLEKIRSERMALQEKLKRTAKCRMSITTPMADVTNSYSTPTKACEPDRSASIVWADSTPTNSHSLEQGTPDKFFSPGFAPVPATASILKKAGRSGK